MAGKLTNVDWPDYLYESPDSWGNVTVITGLDMMLCISDDLRTLGDDWVDVSIDDCADLNLVRVGSRRDAAVYEYRGRAYRRGQDNRIVLRPTPCAPGYYEATNDDPDDLV